ncbi:MAG: ribulokinase [Eubacteriales bacterium]|nr:ribulokinase [Eubacteriales bacterium]
MDLVIGLDFGTDSVRAVVVDTASGAIRGEGVSNYARWARREFCDADEQVFRHHPLDYIEAMTSAVRMSTAGLTETEQQSVRAIGFDTTGSTVSPVDRLGVPLALRTEFERNPDAMFHLWKDHSAVEEAAELDAALRVWPGEDYRQFQGEYSAEWFWAKTLHAVRRDKAVRGAAYAWVELTDWVPALLSGRTNPDTMYRCFSSAGHKALWHGRFGGLPSAACLDTVDPYLAKVSRRYAPRPGLSTDMVGTLTEEWGKRLGLPGEIVVGGSSLDAHAGAVGAGIRPGVLVKVLGTSSVDLAVVREEEIKGESLSSLFGLAQNAVLPGFLGLESGQSAFGDIFAWFKHLLMWSVIGHDGISSRTRDEIEHGLLARLEAAATALEGSPDGLAALDWLNGRRYPEVDYGLKGAFMGLTLGTDAPKMYRALVLAAAFGSKVIFNGITSAGVELQEIIAVGGIAQKSPYIMQTLADVLEHPISVSAAAQACALGAAMYAAVAAGVYADLPAAQRQMGAGFARIYLPDPARAESLKPLFRDYHRLAAFAQEWSRV